LYNGLITIREGLHLGWPILNDMLYVQSKGGKTYKWIKTNVETTSDKQGKTSWEDAYTSSSTCPEAVEPHNDQWEKPAFEWEKVEWDQKADAQDQKPDN
jgi:hypothetical protein